VPPRSLLLALAAVASLAASSASAGELPGAGGIADMTGPRTLGLAAATGIASGNDGLFVNPAAVAARKRYSVEALFLVDRRGATTAGQYTGASIVDALSAPVTASLAWVRPTDGAQRGNLFIGGLAGPLAERFYFGAQVRYLALDQPLSLTQPGATGTEKVSTVTADAGIFWEVSDGISIGFSGFNLVPTGHKTIAPRNVGGGLAIGSDTGVKLMVDWRADLDRLDRTTNRYGAGLEVMLGGLAPVRCGYLKDETLRTSWWTAGAGLVASTGVALDVGYKQSLTNAEARVIAVSLKLQFLEL